jgi:two-component system, cell cycle response regulator DivK
MRLREIAPAKIFRSSCLSKAFSCRAAGGGRMSKRVLVVEDQADNRQIIRDMLAPAEYEITEAENGEEALAAIAKQRPDLILMDIQLPVMDGHTATSRIKADPALRSIPIIHGLSGEERGRAIMFRSPSSHVNCCRKFVSTYLNRFVALHMSAFDTKRISCR